MGIIFLPLIYWLVPSRQIILWRRVILALSKEFKTLLGPNSNPRTPLVIISLFTLIIYRNTLGLLPYIFTRTSHLTMTLTLALPMWIRCILYGWINHTQHIFAHLVPQGTPPALIPFIVCIETVRNIIRPGTLAVRLAANIIAGHLLIVLIRRIAPNINTTILTVLIIMIIALLTLELAVAVIQPFVFASLCAIYAGEI